jgi:hypothetical protein
LRHWKLCLRFSLYTPSTWWSQAVTSINLLNPSGNFTYHQVKH